MKVFDISDKANPKYVASVETACSSRLHLRELNVQTQPDYFD